MMKRLFISIILCFSMASACATIKIQHWKTDNGSDAYFVKTTALPMLDIRVVFAAGSAYDGPQWGLASFVNNMIGQATATKSANAIADAFDGVGASFDTDVNQDQAVVSLRTLTQSKYFTSALATFEDVLVNAQFNQDAFQRTLNQTLATIKVNQETPDKVASTMFNKTLYGNQPYGHPVIGTMQSVKQLSLSALKAFYKKYYVAKNADIVMVGDLSNSEARKIANQLSSALPSGTHAKTLPMMTARETGKVVHVNFPSQQTAILYGQLGITRKNTDYFPLIVGNSILGQLPLTSVLFQNVRNKRGLAYYAISDFDLLQYRGPFEVSLKTRAAKTQESVDVVKQTLSNYINDGPTSEQLQMAKNYISGSFPLSTASNGAILGAVTNIAFYKRPLNYLDTYLQNVNSVTTDQVKQAFQRVLHPNTMILVTVGPNENK